ncbi:hypothetical protein VTP01DRAFT_3622 [Rhizomucor pusillus]|uniref:uncharacterized protein n=1 Tax=Rhizomucor pusillus TaxID=4840 RepID=UPI003743165F
MWQQGNNVRGIERYLEKRNIVEASFIPTTTQREDILGLIRSLIPKFVRRVAQRTFQKRDDFECQIVPFGSYGLGAHTAGADMDLIFLGAWPVERRDFRYLFTSMLRAQPGVTDVDAIMRTKVPIIKCNIYGIPVDISYVRLHLNSIPSNLNLLDNLLLQGIDETCVASMDGED